MMLLRKMTLQTPAVLPAVPETQESDTTPQREKFSKSATDANPSTTDSDSAQSSPKDTSDRRSKPRIQVLIPKGSRDRPLPVLPFFGNSTKPRSNSHGAKAVSTVAISTSTGREHDKGIFESGNASSDSQEEDCSSANSSRSSQTSAEEEYAMGLMKSPPPFSPGNVTGGSLFAPAGDSTQYGIPPSTAPPRRYEHHRTGARDLSNLSTCEREYTRPQPVTRKPVLSRKSSKRERNNSLASSPTMGPIYESTTQPGNLSSPTLSEAEIELHEQLTSFTHLKDAGTFTDHPDWMMSAQSEECPFVWDNILLLRERMEYEASAPRTAGIPREDSCIIEFDEMPPPAVPRRSSKRSSVMSKNKWRLSQLPTDISPYAFRSLSQRRQSRLTITIPECQRTAEESSPSPVTQSSSQPLKRSITPVSAEAVILGLFHSLDHLDDLFALAVLNRGFYRVFKRHELELIKSTLRKMSPAAWEFREVAFPGHDTLLAEDLEMTRPEEEYTPTAYLQLQKQDIRTIRAIKTQLQASCQSFVRPEISLALSSENPMESARVDNALWRIWTFCKIFGSGKGREDDLLAQIDWLKGGPLAHQKVSFSILSTDYMNDTLVGAPESFAKGNEDGLSAEQLFDMMELWNCLGVLLQGFEGRTAQAREAGIFDSTDVRGGDIDGEELMLDEWCYYLLTFGPAAVLEIASSYLQPSCSPFKLALEKGWAEWKPPMPGSTRRNFLKEAASRAYEEKIATTYASVSSRAVQRQQSKVRIQQHITELRKRKNSGERMPTVRMSQERPMSEWDTVITNLTKPPPLPTNNIVSYIPGLRPTLAQEVSSSVAESPEPESSPSTNPPPSPPRRIVAQPLLPSPPPSTVASVRDRSSLAMSMSSVERHFGNRKEETIPEVPSLMDHPAFRDGAMVCPPLPVDHPLYTQSSMESSAQAFQQHQIQRKIQNSHSFENTADKAIYRVVEMGFTAEQARGALRMTDLGDGLRVDRAVELLLSGRVPSWV